MDVCIPQFFTTALGAVCGSYAAYRLAERRLRGRERNDYLALLLVIHEHLTYLQNWLESPTGKDAETGALAFSPPLVMPDIMPEQVQRLMEISPDKDMPRTLMQILYFWRNACKGMTGGAMFCLPEENWKDITKLLKYELLSLQTQYNQARGDSDKFPSLSEVDEA